MDDDATSFGIDGRDKGRHDRDHGFAVGGLDDQQILSGCFLDVEDVSKKFVLCVVDGETFELKEVVFAIFERRKLIALDEDLGTSKDFGLITMVDTFELQEKAVGVFAKQADTCFAEAFFAFALEQKEVDLE